MSLVKCSSLLVTATMTTFMSPAYAHPDGDGLGQTIQIYTQLRSFVGRPSWLLIIRDIDHNQNIPYLYDFTQGDNFWLALTYGHNYLIEASTLQFAPYHRNPFTTRVIHDFCHLESHGRIQRGESMYIMLKGNLAPGCHTYSCSVSKYLDDNFNIYNEDP